MKRINIADYHKRLCAADLIAAVWLEERYDPASNYTWTAAGADWSVEYRKELNDLINNPQCCEERRADYYKALSILDEAEAKEARA